MPKRSHPEQGPWTVGRTACVSNPESDAFSKDLKRSGRLQRHEPSSKPDRDCLRPRVNSELQQQRSQMILDGVSQNPEVARDLLVAHSVAPSRSTLSSRRVSAPS